MDKFNCEKFSKQIQSFLIKLKEQALMHKSIQINGVCNREIGQCSCNKNYIGSDCHIKLQEVNFTKNQDSIYLYLLQYTSKYALVNMNYLIQNYQQSSISLELARALEYSELNIYLTSNKLEIPIIQTFQEKFLMKNKEYSIQYIEQLCQKYQAIQLPNIQQQQQQTLKNQTINSQQQINENKCYFIIEFKQQQYGNNMALKLSVQITKKESSSNTQQQNFNESEIQNMDKYSFAIKLSKLIAISTSSLLLGSILLFIVFKILKSKKQGSQKLLTTSIEETDNEQISNPVNEDFKQFSCIIQINELEGNQSQNQNKSNYPESVCCAMCLSELINNYQIIKTICDHSFHAKSEKYYCVLDRNQIFERLQTELDLILSLTNEEFLKIFQYVLVKQQENKQLIEQETSIQDNGVEKASQQKLNFQLVIRQGEMQILKYSNQNLILSKRNSFSNQIEQQEQQQNKESSSNSIDIPYAQQNYLKLLLNAKQSKYFQKDAPKILQVDKQIQKLFQLKIHRQMSNLAEVQENRLPSECLTQQTQMNQVVLSSTNNSTSSKSQVECKKKIYANKLKKQILKKMPFNINHEKSKTKRSSLLQQLTLTEEAKEAQYNQ
ncbi:hypothetical protein ABPG72_018719 [Tetrahymena utriculariae]